MMAEKRGRTRRAKRNNADVSVEEEESSVQQQQGTTGKKPSTRRPRRDPKADPVTIQNAAKFVEWAMQEGVDGLAKTFSQKLISVLPPAKPAPSFESNMERNRYQDVVCLEETRVKLNKDKPDDTDYIHANWIRFKEHDRTYIATQGPMDNTVEDFWRMVWQEQAPIVVNLTKCCEDGKAKCAQYWPEGKEGSYKQFGRFNVSIKKVDVEEKDKMNVYVLEVLPDGCSNSLIVRMIHSLAWPDGGALHSGVAMLRLIKSIFRVDTLAKGPVIIHCSAGIGRTGTLVLIDYLLYRLFTNKPANLVSAFMELRQARASSIQRDTQFVFIVVAILAYIGHRFEEFKPQWKAFETAFNNRNWNT